MSPLRRVRLSDFMAETRILLKMASVPVVKALLYLAELIVRDGCVKDPIEFYGDLSSQSSTSIARVGEGNGSCSLSVYQVCSPAVRKTAVAMAISPEGVRLKRDHVARFVVLVASPEGPVSPNLALPSKVVSLFGDSARRERMLACAGPAEVLARVREHERQGETTAQGA